VSSCVEDELAIPNKEYFLLYTLSNDRKVMVSEPDAMRVE
jgi:hypothetical protein